jgi:hypothetical protein
MSDDKISKTTPVKTGKQPRLKPEYQKWEIITFLAISAALVFFSLIFWGIFLNYYQNFIGASLASLSAKMTGSIHTILTIVQIIIGWPLILFILALDIFLLFICYRKSKRGIFVIWGLMMIFLLAGVGLATGYNNAQTDRVNLANSQRVQQATEHFLIGEQAIQDGNYALANLQFQYVLQIDPNFPGLVEKMVLVQEQINLKLTPTITPTPTLQPTPDTRSQDEIYAQAIGHRDNQEWVEMFADLETLRNIDPTYKALEMDGLYYLALRNLGIQMIIGDNQRNIAGGHLEEGIYDLNLAEKYAPLDNLANQYRSWARNYINALAYWDVDWEKVVSLLQQVASALPNLPDSNNITAARYYVLSLIHYADQYAYDACTAYPMYQKAMDTNYQLNRLNGDEVTSLQAKIDDTFVKCYPPTPTKLPATATLVPTATEIPTETPTPTP